jgi:3-hydroxyisobutyrate dehydrogenase-like beta-hydroxyacid dehydrogenase
MSKIAVIGAGSWGTTFSKVLADDGSDVMLWFLAVPARLSQTAEALVSVSAVLELVRDKNIAAHLTHMSDTPRGE